jgi:hypothetical protein
METIVINAPRQSLNAGQPTISSVIEIEGVGHDVYMRATRGPLTHTADPFLATALIPAMRLASSIVVRGAVSAGFMENTQRIQDVLCSWYPQDMHRVAISAEAIENERPVERRRVGSFFSGGVDSSYTALKHNAEIDDLIFIHGFDVPLWDSPLRQLVSAHLKEAAGELDHTLLEVETNLRDVLNPYTDWNLHSHGAALGAVALAVAPSFRRIYIGATLSFTTLRAHGSHPLLDPLWAHQSLEVIHDGCEHSRWRKAEQIIGNEVVLKHLRVCWQHPRTEYNCGRCNGCTLVMIFLRATGMAARCPVFPPLDLSLIDAYEIKSSSGRSWLDPLHEIAEERNADADLVQALRARLQRATDEGYFPVVPSPELRRVEAERAGLKVDVRRLQAQLHEVRSSRSWRVTTALRAAGRLARRVFGIGPKSA